MKTEAPKVDITLNLEKLSKPAWMSNLCRLVELLTNLHAYKLLQQMVSRRQHAHSAIANPFNLIFRCSCYKSSKSSHSHCHSSDRIQHGRTSNMSTWTTAQD